ncbi:hypothetical protein JXJ21_04615, partial [candidate division KSB1 bacterium]|nr:hypothetical protein [candidate division KSB1 bacterium]
PVYESSTILMINDDRLASQSIAPLIPGVTSVQQQNAKLLKMKILRRENLVTLIDSLGFKRDEDLQETAQRQQQKYPGLSVEEIKEAMLLESINEHIEVEPIGKEFIKIIAYHHKPVIAYRMASLLTDIYLNQSLQTQLGNIKGAIQFSSEQVEKFRKRLDESEERLQKYRQGIVKSKLNDHPIVSANLDQLNSMLVSTNLEINKTEAELQSLRLKCSRHTNSVQIKLNSFLETSLSQLYSRSEELPQLLLKFDWKSPEVIRLRNELMGLKGEIGKEMYRLSSQQITDENQLNYYVSKKLAEIEFDILTRNRHSITTLLEKYKMNAAADPEHDLKIKRLEEEVMMNRELYNMVLQQKSGTQIQESMKRTEASMQYEIIEHAVKPIKPIKPKKVRLMAMGAMLGLFIGIGIIFLLEYTDDSFKNKEDVEEYLGLIVLGTIPHIRMKLESAWFDRFLKPQLAVPIAMMLGGIIYLIILMFK